MDLGLPIIGAAAFGYLLGSVPFAVIVSRAFGLADPRTVGSGNPGATNVLRSGNKLAAVLTLVGDAAKGALAMWLVSLAVSSVSLSVGAGDTPLVVVVAGVSAFVGHVFPFTLGFKGGKGVATALGVLLMLSPVLGGIVLGVWLATVALTRYSSLGALVAAVASPIAAWYVLANLTGVIAASLMSVVLIVRHKTNITKLLAGTEGRLGAKKTS
ncbi:MAG: glycerol-3-phosphate 1-O-acyltransferase PlsY [Rhodocyclaceae bacterium]|nr:glycerol-3-phosphate 1-O-acyltransferase PlsY [Rhodocyclaceae bacterium]MBL0075016.1 glycerol-3-phosphate 1-O-acyltransferase PlsY [Rhodocyclaceae bacterium]